MGKLLCSIGQSSTSLNKMRSLSMRLWWFGDLMRFTVTYSHLIPCKSVTFLICQNYIPPQTRSPGNICPMSVRIPCFLFIILQPLLCWELWRAAVKIIKESFDSILREKKIHKAHPPTQHGDPFREKANSNPWKMLMIMRWMTCMAACDKEHLFFEQTQPRFLRDTTKLRNISIMHGETRTSFIWCECTA